MPKPSSSKPSHEPRHLSGSREEFATTFAQHGMSLAALQWGNQASQAERFALLAGIGDLNDRSVLDVGCGFAHLADFLELRYPRVKYTGLEIVPEIAAEARRRRPELEIVQGSLDALALGRQWDFVVQSGIFNIACYDFSAAESMLRGMFARANMGVAANFLSRLSTGTFNPRSSYYDVADVATLAQKLSRRFSLLHHYRDNDFTLHLWKDPQHPGLEAAPGVIEASGIRRP